MKTKSHWVAKTSKIAACLKYQFVSTPSQFTSYILTISETKTQNKGGQETYLIISY